MRLVITMSRRYGTGASVIAKELSERLDIPVYDKVDVEEEIRKNAYETEAEVIRELAEKPCIILGRCASEILKDQSNVFNIYVCGEGRPDSPGDGTGISFTGRSRSAHPGNR